jgi:hypothetical protein
MIFVLVLGIAMLAWGTWSRLGRTPGARTWATTSSRPETRLFLVPFGGAALVLIALLTPLDDVPAVLVPVGLLAFVCAFVAVVFGMLGVPAPGFLKPRWYRELERRGRKKPASKRAATRSTPASPATRSASAATDPAWTPVREALRADVAALAPGGSVAMTADAQRFVEVWHYGDRLSVDCAGSQEWGGPAPIGPAQQDALEALGFTTPMQRRGEIERHTTFRHYLPTDDPARAAARAAELAVEALAILGVAPEAHLERARS